MSDKIFCDIFAGTGIVGRTFKTSVKKVISNDIEYYSYVLNKNYIENHREIKNKNEMLTVTGVGEYKFEKYGERFLTEIT